MHMYEDLLYKIITLNLFNFCFQGRIQDGVQNFWVG